MPDITQTIDIDGVPHRWTLTPIEDASPAVPESVPEREVGAAYLPGYGDRYVCVAVNGDRYTETWRDDSVDRHFRALGCCHPNTGEGRAAARRWLRDHVAFDKARRILADLRARGHGPGYYTATSETGPDACETLCAGCVEVVTPWSFDTREGARLFAHHMGTDLHILLTGAARTGGGGE